MEINFTQLLSLLIDSNATTRGLFLNTVGAICLAISTQIGMSVGGLDKDEGNMTHRDVTKHKLEFKNKYWFFINRSGWFWLIVGFSFQFFN